MKKLPPKCISLIHVAARALRLGDDDRRAILMRVAGVASARELDHLGFIAVMEEFQRLGFKSTWRKATGGYRDGMATPAQIQLINRLWGEYRGEADAEGFRHWLERFHKVSDVRFVTASRANAVITALKRMASAGHAA